MIAQLRELLAPLRQSLNAKLLRWTGSQPCTPAGCLPAKTGGQCDGQYLKSVSSRLLRQQNAHLRMQVKRGFCGRDRTLSVAPERQR